MSLPFFFDEVDTCDPNNVTFSVYENHSSISWNIRNFIETCTFSVNIRSCNDLKVILCVCNVSGVEGEHVTTSLDDCEHPNGKQGNCLKYLGGVTVDVRYNNISCNDDNTCESPPYYIPDNVDTG